MCPRVTENSDTRIYLHISKHGDCARLNQSKLLSKHKTNKNKTAYLWQYIFSKINVDSQYIYRNTT